MYYSRDSKGILGTYYIEDTGHAPGGEDIEHILYMWSMQERRYMQYVKARELQLFVGCLLRLEERLCVSF